MLYSSWTQNNLKTGAVLSKCSLPRNKNRQEVSNVACGGLAGLRKDFLTSFRDPMVAPMHIERHGPATYSMAETIECTNATMREFSVKSNRQAPSRDIARNSCEE